MTWLTWPDGWVDWRDLMADVTWRLTWWRDLAADVTWLTWLDDLRDVMAEVTSVIDVMTASVKWCELTADVNSGDVWRGRLSRFLCGKLLHLCRGHQGDYLCPVLYSTTPLYVKLTKVTNKRRIKQKLYRQGVGDGETLRIWKRMGIISPDYR